MGIGKYTQNYMGMNTLVAIPIYPHIIHIIIYEVGYSMDMFKYQFQACWMLTFESEINGRDHSNWDTQYFDLNRNRNSDWINLRRPSWFILDLQWEQTKLIWKEHQNNPVEESTILGYCSQQRPQMTFLYYIYILFIYLFKN